MESDIILEGFKDCKEKYGITYTRCIGDGDSSTFYKLLNQGPPWCRDLKKIECANHACKCLRTHLEKLVVDNPNYKGRHGLTKSKRAHMVAFIRHCIRIRSQCPDEKKGAKYLINDIKTSMWHVYGQHRHCSPEVCKGTAVKINSSAETQSMPAEEIFTDQKDEDSHGNDGMKGEKPMSIAPFVINDVAIILARMAEKSESLITNSTTNLCESWMGLRSKFDGGKQINRCGKGSWNARCYGAALRSSLGPHWSPKVWTAVTNQPVGKEFCKVFKRKATMLGTNKRLTSTLEYKKRAVKRKYSRIVQSQTKKVRLEYGTESLKVSPDIGRKDLEEACLLFFEEKVSKSLDAIEVIEKNTRQQSMDGNWHKERAVRVTASNFGAVVKRKNTLSTAPLVKRLLYSSFKGNKYTEYGLSQEDRTKEIYVNKSLEAGKTVTLSNSGLIISKIQPFLACSPDGIVTDMVTGETGLMELKNVLMGKPITLSDAAYKIKTFCLQQNEHHTLQLKTNHPYYFQCQGLLAINQLPWLDFVVRTTNPPDLHIERISPDVKLWNEVMLPRLALFYFESLLPELCAPRYGQDPGIRGSVIGLNARLLNEGSQGFPSSSGSSSATSNTEDAKPKNISWTRVKFLGKHIVHKWVLDEITNEFQWYNGDIIRLLKGKDGTKSAVYEVGYSGDDTLYELSRKEIVEDLNDANLKFID